MKDSHDDQVVQKDCALKYLTVSSVKPCADNSDTVIIEGDLNVRFALLQRCLNEIGFTVRQLGRTKAVLARGMGCLFIVDPVGSYSLSRAPTEASAYSLLQVLDERIDKEMNHE